jgi:hypothetical protein
MCITHETLTDAWDVFPQNNASFLSEQENNLQWAFKLNSSVTTAETLHLKCHKL